MATRKSKTRFPFPTRFFDSTCLVLAVIGVYTLLSPATIVLATLLAIALLMVLSITAVVVGGIWNNRYQSSIRHIQEARTKQTKITEGND